MMIRGWPEVGEQRRARPGAPSGKGLDKEATVPTSDLSSSTSRRLRRWKGTRSSRVPAAVSPTPTSRRDCVVGQTDPAAAPTLAHGHERASLRPQ